ncbi:sigma-54 factor interaction domain-containing protein [Gemmatirosa kalamazoonensis]|uniref:Sigma-54 factor interaction domain-containing protein n=1 Tax=Gemmatirosa kalamazoonensis TaxID=861299 RepID=W0RP38_9BACT|nr:sigma 54-interacting transcriptional regulator [Gemmatirosa kalamazoonensis]AHG91213.1 sigma-54 factor interaction domain-containing protein [Gemmatirosa kalamazoonensis]
MPEPDRTSTILTAAWREAARHEPLAVTLPRIAELLASTVRAEQLVVRHLDRDRGRLTTVAAAALRPAAAPWPLVTSELSPDDLVTLGAWARQPTPAVLDGTADRRARLLGPVGDAAECLAAPLGDGDGPTGVFALASRARGRFDDAAAALAAAMAAPLGTALAGDLRLQEFARLREALEADRAALLQRLDRVAVVDSIVGADSGLRHVIARVDQVAPTDAPVLLFGETGSGKEVVARAIHQRSRRASGPIVRVNCGALPAGLLDSELFGHERGSFTGAVSARKGWFERADGGTLFLDEVAELPLDAQVRLLRILQDGTFERVGGQRSLNVDVRIVAATHRDLADMVRRGSFREDLWYRISVFPIDIPPLRARPQDVAALASHFAARAGVRLGGAPLALAPEDVALLARYDWPGNVRELAAVVERAAILGDGRRLRIDLALGRADGTGTRERGAALPVPEDIAPLDEAIRRHVVSALRATGGRIEGKDGAAMLLGINPHTLRARMRKLGIDWSRFRDASTYHGERP